MKKRVAILIGLFIILLVCVFFKPVASRLLTNKIHSALKEGCRACVLKTEGLEITSVFPIHISSGKVEFKDDPKANPMVDFTLDSLEVGILPFSLFSGAPTIEFVETKKLHVTVREPSKKDPPSGPKFPPTGEGLISMPAMRVGRVRVHDSKFTYEHIFPNRTSHLDVYQVQAKAEAVSGYVVTRADLQTPGAPCRIKMEADARLENRGKVILKIHFDPFLDKNQDDIIIDLQDQPLAQLNPFFRKESGVLFEGVLKHGQALMKVSEGRLTGTLQGAYSDLGIKMETTKDRSAIESFFTNVIASVILKKTRPEKDEKHPPKAAFAVKRQAYEPITKMILRGLQDAVNKITRE